jgi:hypothetical protein
MTGDRRSLSLVVFLNLWVLVHGIGRPLRLRFEVANRLLRRLDKFMLPGKRALITCETKMILFFVAMVSANSATHSHSPARWWHNWTAELDRWSTGTTLFGRAAVADRGTRPPLDASWRRSGDNGRPAVSLGQFAPPGLAHRTH